MKFEQKLNIGCNQAGKGDKDRSLSNNKKINFRKNFDSIFKQDSLKEMCAGCNVNKNWKYSILNKQGKFHYCEDCKSAYLKMKKTT